MTVTSHRMRLDNLFKLFNSLPDNLEIRAHWTRYLCVLTSGFIEKSVIELYSSYAISKSAPNVANYLTTKISGFMNPNMEKLIQLATSFNSAWGEELAAMSQNRIKNSIDSIYNNRNQIAHGENVGVGYINLQVWYSDAKEVVYVIENQCGG